MRLLGRTAPRVQPWEPGFAVRRDWPDGTHDLVGFHLTQAEAGWFAVADRNYWRRGPLRPLRHAVVAISGRDFELHVHRRDCRAPDCPTVPPVSKVLTFDVGLQGDGRAR